MERTIDRSSYRRNMRRDIKKEEKISPKFNFIKTFMNQCIIGLLIIIILLVAKFFDITYINEWFLENMSKGIEVSTLCAMIKENFEKYFGNISGDNFMNVVSGEIFSGDINNISGEIILEKIISGETTFQTAVEGINQMSDDANYIKSNYNVVSPLKGTITSHFGTRISDSKIVSAYHTGLDIAANTGTEFISAISGKVTLAENFSTYGKCIIIENGDLYILYAHCSSINVKKGQEVKQGDKIGKVGMTGNATGPHLHFEIRYCGRFVNPEDVLGEL